MQRNNVCTECVIYMEMYNYGLYGLNMDDTRKTFLGKIKRF